MAFLDSNDGADPTCFELTLCGSCRLPFDDQERIPKYLDCHHTFCSLCIPGFHRHEEAGSILISCPLCRKRTTMSGMTLINLETNPYALNLVAATLSNSNTSTQLPELWCSNCSSLATSNCKDKHKTGQLQSLILKKKGSIQKRQEYLFDLWEKTIAAQNQFQQNCRTSSQMLTVLQNQVQVAMQFSDNLIFEILVNRQQLKCWPPLLSTMDVRQLDDRLAQIEKWKESAENLVSEFPLNEVLPQLGTADGSTQFWRKDLLAMVSFIMTLLPKEEPDNEDETTDRAPESPMAPAPVPPPVPSTVPPAVPPPKTSTRRGSRALRQRKTPNEAQSFECPHCTKAFRTKALHEQHLKVHITEKSFCCPDCDKSFKWESSLKVHIRTHTGERPYSCAYCDKTFHRSDHKQLHQMKCENRV